MRVKLFSRIPRPAGEPDPSDATDPTGLGTWALPPTRTCRGVQLVHLGQICSCINDACPDPEGPHTVSFRCIVMADPCPSCGAEGWARTPTQ